MIHGFPRPGVALLLLAAPSCGVTSPELDAEGVVRFVDLEGRCRGIESGGRMLEPLDLPAAFHEDGLALPFQAEVRRDVATICRIGTPIELLRIDRAR